MVVSEDNTIYYKGKSHEYTYPNNENKSTFFKWQIWDNPDDYENIVDIAVGQSFFTIVTESGNVWACGRQFLKHLSQ